MMNKNYFLLLAGAIILFFASLLMRSSKHNNIEESVEFTTEQTEVTLVNRSIDLGKIKKRQDIVADGKYEIINAGDHDLMISDVKVSCSCTALKGPLDLVKPGDTAIIEVKYTKNKLGYFYSDVLVHGNFNTSPEVLSFEGFLVDN